MGFNYASVEPLIGKESGVISALDTVSKSDIRHWIEIIDENSTHYLDIDWDNKTAPPAMYMIWTMPPLWDMEHKEPSEPHELALKALDDAGYDTHIGIELEQETFLPVKVDDKLSYTVKVVDISKEKVEKKIGNGYQVDLAYTIFNQNGDVVSKQTYSLLKFKRLDS